MTPVGSGEKKYMEASIVKAESLAARLETGRRY
jgi:hypothetical protein